MKYSLRTYRRKANAVGYKLRRISQRHPDGSIVRDCNGDAWKGYILYDLSNGNPVLCGYNGVIGDWTLDDVEAFLTCVYREKNLTF